MSIRRTLLFMSLVLTCSIGQAAEVVPKIAWFGTLKSGLAEARETGKPILFVSAAPHCLGVPGEW